jgi:hypothetical protein
VRVSDLRGGGSMGARTKIEVRVQEVEAPIRCHTRVEVRQA